MIGKDHLSPVQSFFAELEALGLLTFSFENGLPIGAILWLAMPEHDHVEPVKRAYKIDYSPEQARFTGKFTGETGTTGELDQSVVVALNAYFKAKFSK